MSNLSETLCLKVSKEMKSFLDDTENSSDYVRQLILQNMRIRKKMEDISSLEEHDGEAIYAYDEDKLLELVNNEVAKTIMCKVFNESKIILK